MNRITAPLLLILSVFLSGTFTEQPVQAEEAVPASRELIVEYADGRPAKYDRLWLLCPVKKSGSGEQIFPTIELSELILKPGAAISGGIFTCTYPKHPRLDEYPTPLVTNNGQPIMLQCKKIDLRSNSKSKDAPAQLRYITKDSGEFFPDGRGRQILYSITEAWCVEAT